MTVQNLAKQEIKKMNEKFAEENRQGPLLATSDDFKGVDTDKKKPNIEAFEGSALAGILGTLQESWRICYFQLIILPSGNPRQHRTCHRGAS